MTPGPVHTCRRSVRSALSTLEGSQLACSELPKLQRASWTSATMWQGSESTNEARELQLICLLCAGVMAAVRAAGIWMKV